MNSQWRLVAPLLVALGACSADPGSDPSLGTVGEALEVPSAQFTFVKTADWGSGYNARIDLTNNGSAPLVDWQAQFDMPFNVEVNVSLPQDRWAVLFTPGIDNLVTISGPDPSDAIAPGETRSIYLYGDYEGSFGYPLRCRFPSVNDAVACDGSTDTTPPLFPAGTSATVLPSSVDAYFLWGPATDDVGVTGYMLYWTEEHPGAPPLREIGEIPTTFARVTRLLSGVTYGFRVTARDQAGNESTYLQVPSVPIGAPPLTATFDVVNQWPAGGFQGEFHITNTGTAPVFEWRFSFTFTGTFTSVWNARGGTGTGPTYGFVAPTYDLQLDPGETTVVGVTGTFGTPATMPSGFSFAMGFGDFRPLAIAQPSPCATTTCPSPTHCVLMSSGIPTCVP